MIKQELVEYIKAQLQKGQNKEEIKLSLVNAGWQAQDIEDGFKVSESNIPMSQSAVPFSSNNSGVTSQGIKSFSISEALSFGFNTWKNNLGFFAIIMIVMSLVYVSPEVLGYLLKLPSDSGNILDLIKLIIGIVLMVIEMGFIKILLKLQENQKPDFADLFSQSQFSLILNFFIVSFVYSLAYGFGLILFIIPGIIMYVQFQFAKYVVIDKGLSLNSFHVSKLITKGVKWNLLFFNIIFLVINFIGFLFLEIGLFVTIPITMLAETYIYRKLLAQTAI